MPRSPASATAHALAALALTAAVAPAPVHAAPACPGRGLAGIQAEGRRLTPLCRPARPSIDRPNVATPRVEGPVEGGSGRPFFAGTGFDLTRVGYEQHEYFISGTASSYVALGRLESDGKWRVAPASTAEYRTRIVVHRPIDARDFNGTVVVEWLNVSGGLDAAPDWISMHTELTREGSAWVGVSAQSVGVEGGTPILGGAATGLKQADPERYASLHHPGDSFSYDIFSQAGRAVRGAPGIDVLRGLDPERVIAVGESQSAFRLTTYVNAIDPVARLFDGYLIHSRGGGSAALSQAPEEVVNTPAVVRTRTDGRVPVLVFQTETDLMTLGYLADRQPDSANFRLWEVAGTAHADTYTLLVGQGDLGDSTRAAEVLLTAEPIPGVIRCDSPVNSGPQHWVLKAAMAALERWVRDGVAPRRAPRLEVAGEPPAYVVDEHGNVRGGIRTPYVDAPVATLSGLGQTGANFCRIFGTTVLLDDATLAELYPSHEAYVAAVARSTDRAVRAGFLLPPDGALVKAAAEESDVGR